MRRSSIDSFLSFLTLWTGPELPDVRLSYIGPKVPPKELIIAAVTSYQQRASANGPKMSDPRFQNLVLQARGAFHRARAESWNALHLLDVLLPSIHCNNESPSLEEAPGQWASWLASKMPCCSSAWLFAAEHLPFVLIFSSSDGFTSQGFDVSCIEAKIFRSCHDSHCFTSCPTNSTGHLRIQGSNKMPSSQNYPSPVYDTFDPESPCWWVRDCVWNVLLQILPSSLIATSANWLRSSKRCLDRSILHILAFALVSGTCLCCLPYELYQRLYVNNVSWKQSSRLKLQMPISSTVMMKLVNGKKAGLGNYDSQLQSTRDLHWAACKA